MRSRLTTQRNSQSQSQSQSQQQQQHKQQRNQAKNSLLSTDNCCISQPGRHSCGVCLFVLL
jgi:hypothetical protein